MKHQYTIALLPGNHGIWLFVRKSGEVVFEQAGIKTIDDAFTFAKAAIEAEEKVKT